MSADGMVTSAPKRFNIDWTLERIQERLEHNSALVDGVQAALQDFVQSSDIQVARLSFSLADVLDRAKEEISDLAKLLRDMDHAKRDTPKG